MLLRIAQADAYGVATEYIKFPQHQDVYDRAKKFERYVKHPTHTEGPGRYTDDTQMSIAISEFLTAGALILDPGEPFLGKRSDYADAFVKTFIRDPRDGYSRALQKILEEVKTGAELTMKVIPTSTKNGAAMRSVPLGVLPGLSLVCEEARTQARVTHDTAVGIHGSQIIALLSHFSLYSDMPYDDTLFNKIKIFVPGYDHLFSVPWRGPVNNRLGSGGDDVGLTTVHAVITLLKEQKTLMGILNQVIEWGGDTDSVAAIAWGIASCRMKEPVPEWMEKDLEPGSQYGPSFLRSLGTRLMAVYNPPIFTDTPEPITDFKNDTVLDNA